MAGKVITIRLIKKLIKTCREKIKKTPFIFSYVLPFYHKLIQMRQNKFWIKW